MHKNIGVQIKKCRKENKMTLKDLSLKTDLSIGYISQLERGLTTVAYNTLAKIAAALNKDLSYFVNQSESSGAISIVRSFEKKISSLDNDNRYLFYLLSDRLSQAQFLPRYVEILPGMNAADDVELDAHEGEEFIYVLDGILTLPYNGETYHLYPGDSVHFESDYEHKWGNDTTNVTKILVINSPNVFKKS